MQKILFLTSTLLFIFFTAKAQVTTAGNGLYKPNSTTLALSDGSISTASPVVFDFAASSTATMHIKKSTSSYWFVNNSGFVGIGQASPTAKLHIRSGSILNTNNALVVENSAASELFKINDAGTTFMAKLFIGTADATTNTKIASYALSVNGDAIFNKARVKLYGVWPDYVFDNTYELAPLSQVESFIKKYRHLPGLLSADEIQKRESIDIGETQAILLKKVEELTLYIIDINKKVETLIKENEALKEKK